MLLIATGLNHASLGFHLNSSYVHWWAATHIFDVMQYLYCHSRYSVKHPNTEQYLVS